MFYFYCINNCLYSKEGLCQLPQSFTIKLFYDENMRWYGGTIPCMNVIAYSSTGVIIS